MGTMTTTTISLGALPPVLCPSDAHSKAAAMVLLDRRKRGCTPGEARIVCIGGDKKAKEDAARKALEQALGGKKEILSKWDQEIKRRESRKGDGGGSGGGGRKGGGGGGSGGFIGPQDESSWNEVKQIFFAFTGLLGFYLLVTNGRKSLVFLINLPRYMAIGGRKALGFIINFPFLLLRGFKRRPLEQEESASLTGSSTTGPSATGPSSTTSSSSRRGSAQAHVISKWGSD